MLYRLDSLSPSTFRHVLKEFLLELSLESAHHVRSSDSSLVMRASEPSLVLLWGLQWLRCMVLNQGGPWFAFGLGTGRTYMERFERPVSGERGCSAAGSSRLILTIPVPLSVSVPTVLISGSVRVRLLRLLAYLSHILHSLFVHAIDLMTSAHHEGLGQVRR